jgi:phasin family protein
MTDSSTAYDATAKVAAFQTDALNAAKEGFSKLAQTNFKTADEVTAFGKANVDALLKAGSTWARGFEEITRSVVETSQSSVDASLAATKAMLAAKTIKEVSDLQSDLAKETYEKLVAEGTRISELSIRLANEALDPINARVNAVVEKVTKPQFTA